MKSIIVVLFVLLAAGPASALHVYGHAGGIIPVPIQPVVIPPMPPRYETIIIQPRQPAAFPPVIFIQPQRRRDPLYLYNDCPPTRFCY